MILNTAFGQPTIAVDTHIFRVANRTGLAPGETVQFARGGKHVMVFGLSPSLAAGGGAEMTLTFADGDKLSVPLKIAAIGGGGQPASQPRTSIGGGGTMSGMDMGHGDPGDAR